MCWAIPPPQHCRAETTRGQPAALRLTQVYHHDVPNQSAFFECARETFCALAIGCGRVLHQRWPALTVSRSVLECIPLREPYLDPLLSNVQ